MTPDERLKFEEDGYLLIRGALTDTETGFYRAAVDRTYAAAPQALAGAALHRLSAVTYCPDLVGLLDHPGVFRYVWSLLGWNVHVYHSHFDVHPPMRERPPYWWHWHQDGGRQNRELETDPRPRMSVKLAFWLSDASTPGRGNLMIVPGSHRTNWLPGPPRRDLEFPRPAGAIEVEASPGDVLLFDRRLWHARSNNFSDVTRKVVFVGYTYRWVAIRDEIGGLPGQDWFGELSPVRRQLLGHVGDGSGDHLWGHFPETTPLHHALAERGLLDPRQPPLRP